MASSSASSARSLLDLVCGCCLGRRHRGTNSDLERAPLLPPSSADQTAGKPFTSSRLGNATAEHQAPRQGQQRGANEGSSSRATSNGAASPESVARKREEKRRLDAARFKHVRESARNALFSIDDSQLLPSSASTSSPTSSSRLSLPPKRDAKKDSQRASLIAASDNAERLYKAALASPKQGTGPSSSPVGLVRHLHLSVHEPARTPSATAEGQEDDILGDVNQEPINDELVNTLPSGSSTKQKNKAKKLPSQHSLRTIRLAAAAEEASPSMSSDTANGTQSSTESAVANKMPTNGDDNDDDDDWGRRGRTRSKRGLVWIESNSAAMTPSSSSTPANQRGKLSEVFPAQVQETKGDEELPKAKVDNALRLNLSNAEASRKMVEDLKKKTADKGLIAQAWNDASS